MRRHGLVLVCTFVLATVTAATAGAHTTPKIRAAQAHARAVYAEINRIGANLEGVVQAYDGAKIELRQVEASLRQNKAKLRVATANFHAAQRRLMARLYSLYVYGKPTELDVLAGSKSLSELINRAESAQVLSSQDAALGREALHFERVVQQRQQSLKQLKQKRVATVNSLAAQKHQIQSALSRQKRLLASIHSSIHSLQVQEARREQRLKAEAEARLRRIAAEQAAAAKAQSQGPGNGIIGSPVGVPIPVGTGAGHPQAAQIALQYLGVPYVWGGASPSGFDCSGLVMYVYAQLGISLPHYTVSQWDATLPISTSEMQPGDLVFFDNLGHVGIYIGGGEFVDAPHTGSVVRIDSLAAWGGSFVGARRVP
ncbi:MAG TPA: NlpC/P60 family protein [Gaiellaceae bacterium]|nr:NlpC/P60 family protein [Gaiellaceae bacterium]